MADDIVTRLLALNHPDAADAADEIERLRGRTNGSADAAHVGAQEADRGC